ncbi:MAG: DUF6017 domain-containing protein [Eubacteriales bacterium]|nr:DUF6017 domain-containing protein [Eubacteriales bacterium]
MSIQFEYFYGSQAEQFSFYRIPKVLFKDKTFSKISTDAKVLYGLMLDRMNLSVKNRWFDDENRVYIIYTVSDIMDELGCAEQKAIKLLSELDIKKGIGLIERKRQGLGKPNIIYVKNFIYQSTLLNCENHNSRVVNIENPELRKSQFSNCGNQSSEIVKNTNQELRFSQTNNTNNNYTDFNDTEKNNTESSDTEIISYPINRGNENNSPPLPEPKGIDTIRWIENRRQYKKLIKKNIDYDIISERYSKAWLDEIVAIMVDVVCSDEPTVRINKQEYPHEVVKSRFLKIDSSHIEYIDFALRSNTSDVRNIRAFLITTIYRSFETADNWFSAKVKHDMANV